MQISFLKRLWVYLKGERIVELYSSKSNRRYFARAKKSESGQWFCQVPKHDKNWEYVNMILHDDGSIEEVKESDTQMNLDRWR